jgi:hypothetical protein
LIWVVVEGTPLVNELDLVDRVYAALYNQTTLARIGSVL